MRNSINYQLGSLYSVITAFLYATQEPFSFPAAKHLNTLQFVALTQVPPCSYPFRFLLETTGQSPGFRRPVSKAAPNYAYLAVIFAIGMTGLLLYNFGLSNAHPIIISAILNLSPFWAALVALVLAGVPIPISRATFLAVSQAHHRHHDGRRSQLGDGATSNIEPIDGQFPSRQLDLCDSRAIVLGLGRNARRQVGFRLMTNPGDRRQFSPRTSS